MSEPTLKQIKALQDVLDSQEVPKANRVIHYFNEETGSIEEIHTSSKLSPRELLQSVTPQDKE
jgi:hypothetical protein